jgi:cytidyltransferase-like protein
MIGETPVYLGRFCPFHSGHEMVIKRLCKKFGESRVLVIIGSSRVKTSITPYSYRERRKMVKIIFPNIKVIPLPDTHNRPKRIGDPNNVIWLAKIKRMEKKMKTKFIFYGGSKKDLEILAMEFPTKVIFDRNYEGLGISGTKIREALITGNTNIIRKSVNKKILSLVLG